MSELTLRGPASRLAEGPYAERADVKENALDRWLAAGYARLLAPWRNRRPGGERFADRVERYGTALAQSTPAELHSTGARLARGLHRQGLQEEGSVTEMLVQHIKIYLNQLLKEVQQHF